MRNARVIFDELAGEWSFTRRIMPGGGMAGRALFARQSDDHLHYAETGILTTDEGAVLEPSRSYDYYYRHDAIVVTYADGPQKGSLFLELPITCSVSAARHLCGEDLYEARYHFMNAQQFSIEFSVSGPRKNYLHRTDFSKISG